MIKFITKDPTLHDVAFKTSSDLGEVHAFCVVQDELGFDIETTGLKFFLHQPLLTVIGTPEVCYVVDNTERSGWPLNEVLDFPGNTDKLWLGHNLKFDFGFAFYRCVPPLLKCYDTQVTEQCLVKGLDASFTQGKQKKKVPGVSVSLKATLYRRTGNNTMEKAVRDEFPLMSFRSATFSTRHIEYAGGDITELWEIREEQLRVARLMEQELQVDLNNAVVPCVALMEARGVLMDQKKWLDAAQLRIDEVERIELEMDEYLRTQGYPQKLRKKTRSYQLDMFGGTPKLAQNKNLNNINYNSSKQLLGLFENMGWDTPEDQKGKATFGKGEIDRFILNNFDSPQKELLRLLKEYKVSLKRMSSFGETFLEKLNPAGGTMHTTYSTNKTVTGRFGSSDPNLQQIPGEQIYRECFIARPGYKIFTADYSSAELRILASMSGDKVMLELVDGDLHSALATPVWRIIYDDPTLVIDPKVHEKERKKSKIVTFSKLYGATVAKTALILNIPLDVAQQCEAAMRAVIPEAFAFLDRQGEFAAEHGYLLFNDVVKSRRFFPEIIRLNAEGLPQLRDEAANMTDYEVGAIGRKASNAPMQGTNGDMMKIAIVNLTHWIVRNNWPDYILLQVHDELVIEMLDDETVNERAEKYAEIMNKAANKFLKGLKMKTEWKLAPHWSK